MRLRWALVAALAVCGMGCAMYDAKAALVRRASFDLQCPAEQLQTTRLGNNTEGVVGCGQRATYVNKCPNPSQALASVGEDQCPWLLNGDTAHASPPR